MSNTGKHYHIATGKASKNRGMFYLCQNKTLDAVYACCVEPAFKEPLLEISEILPVLTIPQKIIETISLALHASEPVAHNEKQLVLTQFMAS